MTNFDIEIQAINSQWIPFIKKFVHHNNYLPNITNVRLTYARGFEVTMLKEVERTPYGFVFFEKACVPNKIKKIPKTELIESE